MLILVRHGRTAVNAAGRFQGRLDAALDELGRRQAEATAALLTAVPIDAVVTSPLLRARQTAAVFGGPVTVDDRWIELDYGTWDDTPVADVTPETWQRWRSDETFTPPGGESLQDLGLRVRDAVAELIVQADERNIVVVSHVSPIKAAVAWALGGTDTLTWKLVLSTASVTRLQRRGDGAALVSFNEAAHVPLA